MKHLIFMVPILFVFSCNTSDNRKEHMAIAKKYVNAVEALDHETMADLLADNYVGYGPSANDSINKSSAMEAWKENSENLYEKIEYTRSQYAGVMIEEGPNKGDWVANWAELNIDYKDGRGSVTIWANTNYKIENGKIVKSFTFYNEADVLRQLGYVFINPNDL